MYQIHKFSNQSKFRKIDKSSNKLKFSAIDASLITIDELLLIIQTQIICIDVDRSSHLNLINFLKDVKKEIEKKELEIIRA